MKVTLPIVTKDEIINKKRVTEYGEKAFNFDVSLGCQKRWEAKFPDNAEREGIVDYVERLKDEKRTSMPVIISKLKAIYCFFDTDMSFMAFLQMFDFTNAEYTKNLINKINELFEVVFDGASEKN